MKYRRIPESAQAESRKYPWVIDFYIEVDRAEFREDVRPIAYYASKYSCDRKVIRRLLRTRKRELDGGNIGGPMPPQYRTSEGQPPPAESSTYGGNGTGTGQVRDSNGTAMGHVREENKSKSKSKSKKKIQMPEKLGETMVEELMLRISIRHSDEKRRHHRGRLEMAIEALRNKGELSDNWTRRIWGYLNQCDISEAKRAGKPHPGAISDQLKGYHRTHPPRGTPSSAQGELS